MKKYLFGFVFGAIVFTGAGVAFADEKDGKPFKALWDTTQALQVEINNLRNALAGIQLTPGPQGVQGTQGEQGIQGLTGSASTVAGPQGPAGAVGPKGDAGADGVNGTNGISGWERVSGPMISNSDGSKTSVATCTQGKKVIGGGYSQITNYIFYVRANYPNSETEWTVTGDGSSSSLIFNAYAICVIAN